MLCPSYSVFQPRPLLSYSPRRGPLIKGCCCFADPPAPHLPPGTLPHRRKLSSVFTAALHRWGVEAYFFFFGGRKKKVGEPWRVSRQRGWCWGMLVKAGNWLSMRAGGSVRSAVGRLPPRPLSTTPHISEARPPPIFPASTKPSVLSTRNKQITRNLLYLPWFRINVSLPTDSVSLPFLPFSLAPNFHWNLITGGEK